MLRMLVIKLVFNMADTELPEELSLSSVLKPRVVNVVWDYFGLKKRIKMAPLLS